MTVIVAIDPGKSGVAVAGSSDHDKAYFYPLPYDRAGHLRAEQLAAFLVAAKANYVLIEKVQALKGSGSTQTFNFGFAVGEANAVVTLFCVTQAVARQAVTPQRWQAKMHQGVPTQLTAKERSLVAYERLFPHRPVKGGPKGGKPDDNVIDALLIMSFGMQEFARHALRPWTLELFGGDP